MSITATSAVSGVAYGVGIATNPVPGGGTTTATTVVPGSVTGDIVLTVVATWPDNFTRTETATVGLPDACAATTTTTTAPPTTTTPTTAPQGVLGVSTSVPTTAPTAVAGVECGPTTLACTGSSDTGSEVAIGFGMLIVGAGLVALKRRPTRTA
jgi:LPXTG-motif cell wall-anchored protein